MSSSNSESESDISSESLISDSDSDINKRCKKPKQSTPKCRNRKSSGARKKLISNGKKNVMGIKGRKNQKD